LSVIGCRPAHASHHDLAVPAR